MFLPKVISRGVIVYKRAHNLNQTQNNFQFNVETTYQMAPSMKVFVSYVRDDGELVADFICVSLTNNLIPTVS